MRAFAHEKMVQSELDPPARPRAQHRGRGATPLPRDRATESPAAQRTGRRLV